VIIREKESSDCKELKMTKVTEFGSTEYIGGVFGG
jgi:hypothetical protein